MQDTKLRNLSCLDSNKRKMHMKNNKRCKTRKKSRSNKKTYQEQLEDHEEHYECMNFSKNARKIFKTCNWHQTLNLTQDSNKKHKIFLISMILLIFFGFFENHFEKEK